MRGGEGLPVLPFTIPPPRTVGTIDPPGDMTNVSAGLTTLGGLSSILNASYAGGADPTGAAACDNALLAAITANPGGAIVFPPGTYLLNGSTLPALTTAGTVVRGAGMTATTIKLGSSFSAAAAFSVDADNCTIQDLQIQGASNTITNNPQCLGIQVRGRNVCLQNHHFINLNGYAIKVINLNAAGSHQVNHQAHIRNIYMEKTSGGIWLNGQNDTIGAMLSDIHGNSIGGGTDTTLDALRLEDAFDVDITNLASSVGSATSGHSIHLVGHCATVRITGGDVGGFPTPASGSGQCAVKIEDGVNGHASSIRLAQLALQTHDTGVSIPGAANDIRFIGCDITQNNNDGVDLAGTGLDIYFRASRLDKNGANPVAATNVYDVNWTGTSHGQFSDCHFSSPIVTQGTSGGVQFSFNFGARNRDQYVLNARFDGSGTTLSNQVNGSNSFPRRFQTIGSPPGLTPRQPAIVSGSAVTNDTGFDSTVYISGGTLTAVAVGGTTITSITSSPAIVRVPVNQTITLTYTGSPAWQWFGE